MYVDPGTLFIGISAFVAGIFGGRQRKNIAWKDAVEYQQLRNEQLNEQAKLDATKIAELTADLAQLRAKPDMTRLSLELQENVRRNTAEHEKIIAAIEHVADILNTIPPIGKS